MEESMNWYRKYSSTNVYDRRSFFSPEFNSLISKLVIEMSRTQGRLLKPVRFGKIRNAISPQFYVLFPDSFLDMEIILCTSINKRYLSSAAIGTEPSTGKRVVLYNPDQAESEYVRSLAHEAKHEIDYSKGKFLPEQEGKDPKKVRKSPEERRARKYEEKIQDIFEKSINKE